MRELKVSIPNEKYDFFMELCNDLGYVSTTTTVPKPLPEPYRVDEVKKKGAEEVRKQSLKETIEMLNEKRENLSKNR